MATEATFTVPSDQFPLGTVFEQLPDVTVELERIIPARDVVIPYFWVRGTEVEDVAGAFTDHPGVKEIQFVDSVKNEHLLRVEWAVDYVDVLSVLTETEIALIEATGTNEQWRFEIRGDDQQDIATFQSSCRELAIPITLTELHALTPEPRRDSLRRDTEFVAESLQGHLAGGFEVATVVGEHKRLPLCVGQPRLSSRLDRRERVQLGQRDRDG